MAQKYLRKVKVESFSNPGKFYIVAETEDGEWQCSCPVWIYRRKQCKHIQRVKQELGIK